MTGFKPLITGRDISLIKLSRDEYLVIACDSSGGIGPKAGDSLQVPGEVVGRFTTRVALMEVVAAGARPVSVINTLSVEANPTGRGIISGVESEIVAIGLEPGMIINGSTEENMITRQTGVGITALGLVDADSLRLGTSLNGDGIYAVGLPSVGREVTRNQGLIADLVVLQRLMSLDWIDEVLPVGSKGISYEAGLLASMSGLAFEPEQAKDIDLQKSAGPGTVLLVTCSLDRGAELADITHLPVHLIGELI